MKEQTGADREHDRRHERPDPSNVAAKEPHHPDDSDAIEHGRQARGGVVVAKEEVEHGVHVKEQRPVHHRVVLIFAGVVEIVGIDRVQTLVMAHGAHTHIDKTQHCPHNQERDPRHDLPVQL